MRLALALLLAATAAAQCVPVSEAPNKIGETTCVKAKVVKVVEGKRGAHYLDLCDDYRSCPLTIVVFEKDLRDVGNIRLLEGKEIEVHGKIVMYKGRAEIILRDKRQLRGEAAKLLRVPSEYDAEKHGKFSAGEFKRRARQPKRDTKSKQD